MEIRCPDTGNEIAPEHFDTDLDIVTSPFTGKQYILSDLHERVFNAARDPEILSNRPKGVIEYHDGPDLCIKSPIRQWFLGYISLSIGLGTCVLFFWLFPHLWCGKTDHQIWAWLFMAFGLPFGLVLVLVALDSFFGSVKITITPELIRVSEGIGPSWFTKKFDRDVIQNISYVKYIPEGHEEAVSRGDESPSFAICIKTKSDKYIGHNLTPVKKTYIAAFLRTELGLNDVSGAEVHQQ